MSVQRRPYDMAQLDTEATRRHKRKRFLLWSTPLTLILLCAAAWCLAPFVATTVARSDADAGRYDSAVTWLTIASVNQATEPYKLAFNQGIIATHRHDFEAAAKYFRQAIVRAPSSEQCLIRVQDVLSSELGGDAMSARLQHQQAVQYYTKALSDLTTHASCFTAYHSLKNRITDKLTAATNDLKKQLYQDQDQTITASRNDATPPTNQQMRTLEALQQEGRVRQQAEGRRGGDISEVEKPW